MKRSETTMRRMSYPQTINPEAALLRKLPSQAIDFVPRGDFGFRFSARFHCQIQYCTRRGPLERPNINPIHFPDPMKAPFSFTGSYSFFQLILPRVFSFISKRNQYVKNDLELVVFCQKKSQKKSQNSMGSEEKYIQSIYN